MIIDCEDIRPDMEHRIAERKAALEKTYFDAKTGDFAGDIQGANSFAVDIGLGSEKTFDNIIKKYAKLGMYDTGIFGTDILTGILLEHGQGQLAFELLAGEKEVSFHTMAAAGATTLWEYWSGKKSHSHPMFGAVTRYLFYYFLGIRQTEGSTGFQHIVIEPVTPEGLDFATGHISAANGKIAVAWQKNRDAAEFVIEIPEGTDARFFYKSENKQLKPGINTFSV
jgi:alpha-L-rhamnosidase